jgi:C4-dicarboxylate transporter, DctM subunit
MDPLIIGLITVVLLFILILLGVHIGVSLAIMSVLGVWWIVGKSSVAVGLLGTVAFSSIMNYTLGVVPMFVLMGLMTNVSGATKDLYDAANVWFGRLRGGLGIATVIANAVFSAVSGVSIASAAMFSKISLPQMLAHGYDKKLALGTVAGSSLLGMLIPPSILLILYGVLANESIGKLFIAGVVPGILLVVIYSVGISLMVKFRPSLVREIATSGAEKEFKKFSLVTLRSWGVVFLIFLVLGGIYCGFFTPTEAGGIGAFGALVLAIVKRRLTWANAWNTLLETGYVTASIFFLLIAAQMYSKMLAISGLASWVSEFCSSLPVPPIVIIIFFMLIYIVMGMVLDSISMLLITIPLMMPVVRTLGLDPVWFGIICVVAIEMGLLTPPFGLVVYTMKAALGDEVTIEEIFLGAFPFLIMMLIFLICLVAFPSISLWLPNLGQ